MLTTQHVEQFNRDGFLVLADAIGEEWVGPLRAAVLRLAASAPRAADPHNDLCIVGDRDNRTLMRINQLHRHARPASLALAGHDVLQDIGRALCGPEFVSTFESVVIKSRGGEAFAWHQDMIHDRSSRIVTVGVYLTDSQGDGALRVLPGTQHDVQPMDEMDARGAGEGVTVAARAGDIVIHDVMLAHGSAPLATKEHRVTWYAEFREESHVVKNPRFGPDWLRARRSLQEIERATYHRTCDLTSYEIGELVDAAYSVRAALEPARY